MLKEIIEKLSIDNAGLLSEQAGERKKRSQKRLESPDCQLDRGFLYQVVLSAALIS